MNLPQVIVTRRLPPKAWNQLTSHAQIRCWEEDRPVDRMWLMDHISEAEGLYCLLTDRIDRDVLKLGKRLRVISTMAVGYDHIAIEECTRRNIPVGYTPGILTETTADLTFALLMAAARRIVEGVDYVRQGHWTTWSPDLLLGKDLAQSTLGIVGFGRIGKAVACRAQGFGMKVLAVGSSRFMDLRDFPWVTAVELSEALAQSDFVSLHVPLTSKTRHLLGAPQFGVMKPTSILINTARGRVVDTQALVEALQSRTIGGAALDVTDPEPLPPSHPLLTFPNCLVLPHLGSASIATRTKMACMAVENLVAGLKGDRLPYCVNPEVYG